MMSREISTMKRRSNSRCKETRQRPREHPANKPAGTASGDGPDSPHPHRARSHYLTRLTVRTGDKVVILKTADIDAIESAGNYQDGNITGAEINSVLQARTKTWSFWNR